VCVRERERAEGERERGREGERERGREGEREKGREGGRESLGARRGGRDEGAGSSADVLSLLYQQHPLFLEELHLASELLLHLHTSAYVSIRQHTSA
jgi:hypothetical protein